MRWIKWWFWAPPKSGETWAQTFFRVAGNWLRLGVSVVAAFVGVAAIIQFGGPLLEQIRVSRVTVTASLGSHERCSRRYPLLVTVQNEGDKAIERLSIELQARRFGRSTNLLHYNEDSLQWDLYVLPGQSLSACYSFPERLAYSQLQLTATPRRVTLVEPQPWMTERLPLSAEQLRAEAARRRALDGTVDSDIVVMGPDDVGYAFPEGATEAEMTAVMRSVYGDPAPAP
jgi:hypothetical protein